MTTHIFISPSHSIFLFYFFKFYFDDTIFYIPNHIWRPHFYIPNHIVLQNFYFLQFFILVLTTPFFILKRKKLIFYFSNIFSEWLILFSFFIFWRASIPIFFKFLSIFILQKFGHFLKKTGRGLSISKWKFQLKISLLFF